MRRACAFAALIEKLNLYKLRAKVIIEDLSEILGVLAAWDGAAPPSAAAPATAAKEAIGLSFIDPRLPALGLRVILPPHRAASAAAELGAVLVDAADYEAHRIALGIPQRRGRFHLWRRLPARSRHGSARRRRFRQGLLRRAGGGVAHGAPRHRAHPRRASCGSMARRRKPARLSSPASASSGTWAPPPPDGRLRCCGSTASPMRSRTARR